MSNSLFIFITYFVIFLIPVLSIIAVILLFYFLAMLFKRRQNLKFTRYLFTVFLIGIIGVTLHFYYLYNNLEYLPRGTVIQSVVSPDEKYMVQTYHYLDISIGRFYKIIRAESVNLETKRAKTIYFNSPEVDPVVEWVDTDRVRIGQKTLNIHTDVYDFRKNSNRQRKRNY